MCGVTMVTLCAVQNIERRAGKDKAVIKKALVELAGESSLRHFQCQTCTRTLSQTPSL